MRHFVLITTPTKIGSVFRPNTPSIFQSEFSSNSDKVFSFGPCVSILRHWCLLIHAFKQIRSVFPKRFRSRTPSGFEIYHGFSHPCSSKYRVSGWLVSRTRYLYLGNGTSSYEYITSRICNNTLRDLTLIKPIVARFVSTVGFLIRYSNDHTK